ncbi:hypothetical protein FHW23_003161 [Curtobacterium pusillum]|uniref:Uncharacterized protein n=1 Tax=Curtobacterium pusillum TaxID=69373 RepID=A0AAW3TBD7_9MICO|nr:hypothetical protein [Curtobacterium pusillum]
MTATVSTRVLSEALGTTGMMMPAMAVMRCRMCA